MPDQTFDHPTLGTLRTDDRRLWEGNLVLPGFGVHGWTDALGVSFYGDEPAPPDPRAFALLEPLMTNAARLPDLAIDALWRELSGRETENAHWWARPGGLETANKVLRRPIAERDDLWRVLKPF